MFVAEAPELSGCAAHCDTQEKVLKNINEGVDLWIVTGREFGNPVPQPRGERLMSFATGMTGPLDSRCGENYHGLAKATHEDGNGLFS